MTYITSRLQIIETSQLCLNILTKMVLKDLIFFFFFFQAEDGIRDLYVTGVQTCALPISRAPPLSAQPAPSRFARPRPDSPARRAGWSSERSSWHPGRNKRRDPGRRPTCRLPARE